MVGGHGRRDTSAAGSRNGLSVIPSVPPTAGARHQTCPFVLHCFGCLGGAAVRRIGLVIEKSVVRLPAKALSSQLGQLSLPSLRGT